MQKIIILALLCALTIAVDPVPVSSTCLEADGYVKINGVCNKCDASCATCTGVLNTECKTCATPYALTAATKKCECATTTEVLGNVGDALACSVGSGAAATVTQDICKVWGGWPKQFFETGNDKACTPCDSTCNTCDTGTAAEANAKCLACWGGVNANDPAAACDYSGTTGYIIGEAGAFVTTTGVEGYYLSTNQFLACKPGCLTCTDGTATCLSCKTGFVVNAAQDGCECTGKFYHDAAAQTCTACTEATCETCDADNKCLSCKEKDGTSAAWEKNSDSTKCVEPAAVVEEDKVETEADANTAANIKPPTTCEATLIGCTACDAADKAKCTACAEKYFQKLNATTNSCDCDATHARNPDGGCGTKCTATCATGEMCKVDAAAKQTCSAAGTSTSTNGLLLTAASMIFAVILA